MKRKNIKLLNLWRCLFVPISMVAWSLEVIALLIMSAVHTACFNKHAARKCLEQIELPW
ncbi:MAG: hypothetical protein LBQ73_11070 [Tannerellaceae bacterium]|jgi:hypothetical protein|nr:hypothetical protein [Tannerellaceae bacterium]